MSIRKISHTKIIAELKNLILNTSYCLPDDVVSYITKSLADSTSEQEKMLLEAIKKNCEIAKAEKLPLCQDTGISIFFVEQGSNIQIDNGANIIDLIDQALKEVYSEKKLRPSIIDDPLDGKNTGDNTPASIHIDYTSSDTLKIGFMAKGGGSENASGITAMAPSDGFNGIKEYVKTMVKEKGINSCPPLIIGIAIGGTIDQAAIASKRALFRKIGERNPDTAYAKREIELKNELNELNIGVMGLGGNNTVMDVFIEKLPRHIATMTVSVSMLCHSARRGEILL